MKSGLLRIVLREEVQVAAPQRHWLLSDYICFQSGVLLVDSSGDRMSKSSRGIVKCEDVEESITAESEVALMLLVH